MMIFMVPFYFLIFKCVIAQLGGDTSKDQELNLLDWSSGIRIGNCQHDTSVPDLIDPLKQALARMITRHCRNASACRLKESVAFTEHQIVLFDGYPRREDRQVFFRFFVVLPYNAVPIERKIEKPLLSARILADVLRMQHSEFSNSLGWQVVYYEKFPRFDPVTTFMNRALIPIGVVAALFMLFLAYWSSTISSSTYASGEGWMVSGSAGGKNAAYRRTLEIIEEQKRKMGPSPAEKMKLEPIALADGPSRRKSEVVLDVNRVSFDLDNASQRSSDVLPEVVHVFHPRESISTTDSIFVTRAGPKHPRRPSVMDDFRREKRKSRGVLSERSRNRSKEGQKRWKAGSIMMSKF